MGEVFVVVADEVRTLANRTQQSTEEIQQKINAPQEGTRDAVSVMKRSRETTSETVNLAAQANDSLNTIAYSLTSSPTFALRYSGRGFPLQGAN